MTIADHALSPTANATVRAQHLDVRATALAPSTSISRETSIGDASSALRWQLTRNCSLAPREAAWAFGLLCGISLMVGLGFLVSGYAFVLGFSGLELAAVGAAWIVWGRHVGDGHVVSLQGRILSVQAVDGRRTTLHEFPAASTRVLHEGPRVFLICGTRRVEVGTQSSVPRRAAFARELRRALASH